MNYSYFPILSLGVYHCSKINLSKESLSFISPKWFLTRNLKEILISIRIQKSRPYRYGV